MKTHITFVIDESGSMSSQQLSVITNINKFLAEQRTVPDPCSVTIRMFSGEQKVVARLKPLTQVEDLTPQTYDPNGSTALLRAMIEEIDQTGRDFAAMPAADRPDKVVFVCMTDGEENASGLNYTASMLRERVTHQTTKYSWEFIYLGANQDAFSTAAQYGFLSNYTSNFNASSAKGIATAYSTVSSNLMRMRSGVVQTTALSVDDQQTIENA